MSSSKPEALIAWSSGKDSAWALHVAREMIAAGVEAHLAAVDLKKLPASFAGRRFEAGLLNDLPADVDPCGENGEFHSFVSAGPMLGRKIAVKVGETVERDGFAFADLLPG
jgi:diphthamide synthase (EF-2-diphthine--ammonia ligase)